MFDWVIARWWQRQSGTIFPGSVCPGPPRRGAAMQTVVHAGRGHWSEGSSFRSVETAKHWRRPLTHAAMSYCLLLWSDLNRGRDAVKRFSSAQLRHSEMSSPPVSSLCLEAAVVRVVLRWNRCFILMLAVHAVQAVAEHVSSALSIYI